MKMLSPEINGQINDLIDELLKIDVLKKVNDEIIEMFKDKINVNPINLHQEKVFFMRATIEEIVKDKQVLKILDDIQEENNKVISSLREISTGDYSNSEFARRFVNHIKKYDNFYYDVVPKQYLRAFQLLLDKYQGGKSVFLKKGRKKLGGDQILLTPILNSSLLKVTQTAGLSDLLFSLRDVTKKGEKDDFVADKQTFITEKGGQIAINLTDLSATAPQLTENHFKLLVFSLHKHCMENDYYTEITYEEYFELKGIKNNKDNREKLRQELKELDAMFFDFRYKERGKWKWEKSSRVLAIMGMNRKGITVSFGDWHKRIDKKTFIDIHKDFFRYPINRNAVGAPTISFKLRELKNMGKNSVKVSILTSLLDIKSSTIEDRGFTYLVEKLEKELLRIEEAEGLEWEFRDGDHSKLSDLNNDYIDFSYKE